MAKELTPRELKRLTVADLVDLHGETKRRLDKIEDRFDAVRAEILRRRLDHAVGTEYETNVTRSWRTSISHERLRSEFGEVWMAQRSTREPYYSVVTIPRKRTAAKVKTNGAAKARRK